MKRETVVDAEPINKVVFRVWHNGDVIALFPELPFDRDGLYCTSYEHVGQHGSADYHGCVCLTRPAKPHEYRDLARELENRGYRLKVVHRRIRKR
jgi:hypothetical protein